MNPHFYGTIGAEPAKAEEPKPRLWPWLTGVAVIALILAWTVSGKEAKAQKQRRRLQQRRRPKAHIDFPEDRGTRRFR